MPAIEPGREEQAPSSKRASDYERLVEQLAQGIHLGRHVPNANGHHLFVLVLVLLKQDEVGLVVFFLLSSTQMLIMRP